MYLRYIRKRRVWFIIVLTIVFLLFMHHIYTVWIALPSMKDTLPSLRYLRHESIDLSRIYPKKTRLNRGIIICLHNDLVAMGISLIKELRCLGITDRIEIYYCFPNELSMESQLFIQQMDTNVHIIDVCTEFFTQNTSYSLSIQLSFQSYWIKPLALYYTTLDEVMLMDADNIFLVNPAKLWSHPKYIDTGTLFFHDRITPLHKFYNRQTKDHTKTMLQSMMEVFDYQRFDLIGPKPSMQFLESLAYQQLSCHEQDSSLLLWNKSRAKGTKVMEILAYLLFELRFQYKFSWGDKEIYWLTYEFAQESYYFSPYGLSLIDSVPNGDMRDHPMTLCGSMAHYIPPWNDTTLHTFPPNLLYVNGKALLDPYPLGLNKTLALKNYSRLFNISPTHVTPRYERKFHAKDQGLNNFECLENMGATLLPFHFRKYLMRRRMHYFAICMEYYDPLNYCEWNGS